YMSLYIVTCLFFEYYAYLLDLPSFPTRRSSDLDYCRSNLHHGTDVGSTQARLCRAPPDGSRDQPLRGKRAEHHRHENVAGNTGADRKSTRLNSSHDQISYAVFCLKKKKKKKIID